MNLPTLFRRRFIPNELIPLTDDEILVMENNLIITRWVTLHPRKDIARGISAFYIDQGIKVSKIYDKYDNVVYWYCDIIQIKKDNEKNTVVFEDLLVDVILYNDGTLRVLDLDELADALEQKLITLSEATYALRILDTLLKIISEQRFETLKAPVNLAEEL
jgi:predicted RNA-binding protein associated with RNAse of E/G family